MPLESGVRVGEYEIVGAVGAGGMGEVYRARDHRLGRDVAIKVLPEALAGNQDRLLRLQREAQSAGSLNHPNLLTIHELGVDRGRPFIVSELLDGSTLRDRMSAGPLAPKRAADYASQIAEGLAAAHERGIVHRDLKPENIFVTRDGRVKILDFGLAKSVEPVVSAGISETVKKSLTDPGTVIGTVGYMSPEQVRGDSVDARSDIFTLGAILYEMLSGRRAFHGTSSVDTLHAILHADPPELSDTNPQIPPALARIVNHCLEKDPERRFQAARDLAFALQSMSGISSDAIVAAGRKSARPVVPLVVGAILAAAAAGFFVARSIRHPSTPHFERVTYRKLGYPNGAFTTDQQSIMYSTYVPGGGSGEIEVAQIGSPEARTTGLAALVLSVSSKGEAAVLLKPQAVGGFVVTGTVARVPISGGAPREIAGDAQWADWTPSGDDMLILRTAGGRARIEFPPGHVRYETTGWITTPKFSPDGKDIAFIEHPLPLDDAGFIALVDAAGQKRVLSPYYASAQGLAWSPDGHDIWFTAAEHGGARVVYAVSRAGKVRLIASAPGTLMIHDLARDGRALVTNSDTRQRTFVHRAGENRDREFSWLDWTLLRDMSADGRVILFDETGDGGGSNQGVYIRATDGSPAVRLGDGYANALSPDGASVLAVKRTAGWAQMFLYPTGPGVSRQITTDPMNHTMGTFTADGKSLIYRATDNRHPAQLYIQRLADGARRVLVANDVGGARMVCSPDDKWVVYRTPSSATMLAALSGGAPRLLPIGTITAIVGWSSPTGLLYCDRSDNPVRVMQLDVVTGRSTPVRDFTIPESVIGAQSVRISDDGRTYAYTIATSSSDLYILDGVK